MNHWKWKKSHQIRKDKKYRLDKTFHKGDPAAYLFAYLFGAPDQPRPEYEPTKVTNVLIYDADLRYVGMIDDYEYLSWTRKWRRPHTFELQINRYKNNANQLQAGYFVVVSRGGQYRAGRVEHRELGLDQEGKLSENWKIVGKSVSNTFEHRIAIHLTDSGNGYDEQSEVAEMLMRHYVDVNCIDPKDDTRKVPGLVLGTPYIRGPSLSYRARFQTVADILEELSYVSGLGYDVRFDLEQSQFVFDVLEGKDLTQSQTEHPPVTFSPEFGNVQMISYRYSELDVKNVAYVAGQGAAEEREVIEMSDGTQSGFNRREMLVDARDLETTAQLQQRGEEKLAEYASQLILEIKHLPGGPFTYMTDFDLGDIVHAVYPEIGSMDARIVEVVEQIDVTGDQYYITLGNEWPDIIGIMSREQRNNSVESRR